MREERQDAAPTRRPDDAGERIAEDRRAEEAGRRDDPQRGDLVSEGGTDEMYDGTPEDRVGG